MTQPEALRLADWIDSGFDPGDMAEFGFDQIVAELRRLHDENEQHLRHLKFVERWVVHHGTKPTMTAEEILVVIQHHPGIVRITESYTDGKRPDTFDPYARIAQLEAENQRLRRNWCTSYAGASAYTDDGEAQDNRDLPTIDFLRDSVPEIEDTIRRRGLKQLSERSRPALSDEQIEALPVWANFVGLFPEARKEIVRAIEAAQAAGDPT